MRSLFTSPASSRMRRCLVIAWREISVRSFSRMVGRGPPAQSWVTIARRTGSPSAAKTGAANAGAAMAGSGSRPAREILLDQLALMRPAALVGLEGLVAAGSGQLVEAGFGDRQQGPAFCIAQHEGDEGHRLV